MPISAIEKTVTEHTGMTMSDLEHLATISDLHQTAVDHMRSAARAITSIEDQLRAAISSARRDLDTAWAALDAGYSINPGGILQSTGHEIDLLAARRHDAYARLVAACRTAAALPQPDLITRAWGSRHDTVQHGTPAVQITEARDRDDAEAIAERFNGEVVTRTLPTSTWRPHTR